MKRVCITHTPHLSRQLIWLHYNIRVYCVKRTPVFFAEMICCQQALHSGALFSPVQCRVVVYWELVHIHTPSYITHKFGPLKKRMKTTPKSSVVCRQKIDFGLSRRDTGSVYFLTHNKPHLHLGAISQRTRRITHNFLICAHDLTLRIIKLSVNSSLKSSTTLKLERLGSNSERRNILTWHTHFFIYQYGSNNFQQSSSLLEYY